MLVIGLLNCRYDSENYIFTRLLAGSALGEVKDEGGAEDGVAINIGELEVAAVDGRPVVVVGEDIHLLRGTERNIEDSLAVDNGSVGVHADVILLRLEELQGVTSSKGVINEIREALLSVATGVALTSRIDDTGASEGVGHGLDTGELAGLEPGVLLGHQLTDVLTAVAGRADGGGVAVAAAAGARAGALAGTAVMVVGAAAGAGAHGLTASAASTGSPLVLLLGGSSGEESGDEEGAGEE